jgi:hypothetical protein
MFSPPLNSGPSAQQSQPAQSNLTASAPAQNLSPPPAETVQRSNTVGARGRRLSDSGKKRGVSPVSIAPIPALPSKGPSDFESIVGSQLTGRWENGSFETTVIFSGARWNRRESRGAEFHPPSRIIRTPQTDRRSQVEQRNNEKKKGSIWTRKRN